MLHTASIELKTASTIALTFRQTHRRPVMEATVGEDDRTIRALAVDLPVPEPNAAPSQVLEPEQLVEQRTAPPATEAPVEAQQCPDGQATC